MGSQLLSLHQLQTHSFTIGATFRIRDEAENNPADIVEM